MAAPGIKGTVFSAIVEHVRALRDAGKIDPSLLEHRLGAKGVEVLEQKILPMNWYPIEVYGRLRDLLCEIEGGGKDEYTVAAAAESARRLKAGGLYQQLNYLERWQAHATTGDAAADAEARRNLFRSQLVLVSTIYAGLFNFGTTKIDPDPEFPDRFQLEYWDAGLMPRAGRLAVLGFWSEMSLSWVTRKDEPLFYKTDHADHYVIRMRRDVARM
ncbi:MAG TPA: hypothetical protein VMW35_14480 [Myxococcota bacterium]|jgi:hypothetical protein|nr:hypothetical protein [Myxococcota bacterium]